MNTDQPTSSDKTNVKIIVAVVLGFIVLICLIGAMVYALSIDPGRTSNLRDMIIIVLALVTLLTTLLNGVLLAIALFRVQKLVASAQIEIGSILARANQTINVVRNTTTLVNENIARPAIRVASFLAGLQRGGKVASGKIGKHL